MKRPSIIQLFFAKTWLWNCAFWVCPIIIGLIFLIPLYSSLEGYGDFVKAIFSGAILGFFCSYFPLSILAKILMKINGAPFHDGDMVHILAGKHRGKIVRVYKIWEERKEVRVDIGEQAKKDVEDVYSYTEVCRESSAKHIA